MAVYINPHLRIHLEGQCDADEVGVPPRREAGQDLRRVYDLRCYTVEELTDLLGEIETVVRGWVASHPGN